MAKFIFTYGQSIFGIKRVTSNEEILYVLAIEQGSRTLDVNDFKDVTGQPLPSGDTIELLQDGIVTIPELDGWFTDLMPLKDVNGNMYFSFSYTEPQA